MFTKISVAALFAGLVAAQGGSNPSGNPVHSPLGGYIQACQPLTITWTPTTAGPISIYLTIGDTQHSVPQSTPFAANIPNSGTYTWNVPSTLDATTTPGGYGLLIVDSVTKAYQYSPQIGLQKGSCGASSSAAVSSYSAAPSSSAAGYPVASSVKVSSYVASSVKTTMSTACSTSTMPSYPMNNTTVAYSTGAPTASVTVPVYPTDSAVATTSRLPQATGAASALQAGVGFVGAVAAFALMI